MIPSELQYISLSQYKLNNPDLVNLPKEILHYRYERYERFRIETIQLVKQQREQLMKNSINKSNKSIHQKSYDFFSQCFRNNMQFIY